MFSYILDKNHLIDGKNAFEYFKEDNKITNKKVFEDMKLAVDTPTDVILFNIDSKSDQTSKQSKDAIVNVFLKVFNEMQGFYGANPALADLERALSEDNLYEDFQRVFKEVSGNEWKERRNYFNYELVFVAEALAKISYRNMSIDDAKIVCENILQQNFQISIEDFARLVRKYLDEKGNNHHIVFCVDEVGQYIGDDSQMMLNLQTMREELGKECLGRAWVVATSQEDIDATLGTMTQRKGTDFSKIQGRFDTRLTLTSSNVDEVIKKRLLEKTETAHDDLVQLYDSKAIALKSKIRFEKTPEMKLYADGDDFAAMYPFIPYQFDLLPNVLTAIRTHSTKGKHLSEGERSLLAACQTSAQKLMGKEAGALVPFYMFYDALYSFVDSPYSRVLNKALENKHINPDGDNNCFAVNVLKVLFMVKYVKAMECTSVNNITSLMVGSVDEDIYTLKNNVEAALKVLIAEHLVQERSGNYIFLTEEEQEIDRDIANQDVESGDIQNELAKLIFDDLYKITRYKYEKFSGRYTYGFNQLLDGRPYKNNQNFDVGVQIVTPYYSNCNEFTLASMSSKDSNLPQVVIELPEGNYHAEINQYLHINKYLQRNPATQMDRFKLIKDGKVIEMSERLANARMSLEDALRQARIYVNGNLSNIGSKDINIRINEALGKLINAVYYKLNYIDTVMNSDNILALLKGNRNTVLDMGGATVPNAKALEEVQRYIKTMTVGHGRVSLKTIKDYFKRAPYGFIDDDIECLIARLLKNGDIAMHYQQVTLSLVKGRIEDITDYITKRTYVDKVMIEPKEQVSPDKIAAVKSVAKDLFGYTYTQSEADAVMGEFQKDADGLLKLLYGLNNNYINSVNKYPGRDVLKRGISMMEQAKALADTLNFYSYIVQQEDDLLEFADDYLPIQQFFENQRAIFDKACIKIRVYKSSQTYLDDAGLQDIVKAISDIIEAKAPYRLIRKLPELMEAFEEKYQQILKANLESVIDNINLNKMYVLAELSKKSYAEQKKEAFSEEFNKLIEQAEVSENIAILCSFKDQAGKVKEKLYEKMDILDAEEAKKQEKIKKDKEESKSGGAKPATAANNGGQEEKVVYKLPMIYNAAQEASILRTSWMVKTEADLDMFIEQLRKQLKEKLVKDRTVIFRF